MQQTKQSFKINFKTFNEYPGAFEDIVNLSKEDFLGFLFATFNHIQDQIQDGSNVNLPLTEIKLFRQALNLCNQAGNMEPLGGIELRDIALTLIGGIKLLLTLRDANILKEQPKNPQYLFQIKYTNTLFQEVISKFVEMKDYWKRTGFT